MIQKCISCGQDFEITEGDLSFYAGIDVPKQKKCPNCRLLRLLLERNTRQLYYRKCDFSGRKIISMYHEKQLFPVYEPSAWWGDGWDDLAQGMDFDFNRPFFEQFKELKNSVPHFSVFTVNVENSEFTNCAGYIKDCYLIFEADYDEDCFYSNRIYHSNDCIDCSNCYDCECCYELIDGLNCYGLKYSQECTDCHDGYFLKNCIGCKECIGCMNQRQKTFMIFNEQYTEDEYKEKKAQMGLDSYDGLKDLEKKAWDFFVNQPHKQWEGEQNENVVGDHVYNSKNAFHCFDCKDLEDCKYCYRSASHVKNCFDYSGYGFKAEFVYESAACGDNVNNLKFCSTCATNSSDLEYCFGCTSCSNCFGCASLKKKKFCILNKQYSEADFKTLRGKIIEYMKETGEWGEFFPNEICPYGYNESLAMEQFPMTKEEAISKGFKWSDYEMPAPEIASDVVVCEVTGKPFRLIKQELDFYKSWNLPLPRRSPNQRHFDRLAKRPLYGLRRTSCSNCGKEIDANILSYQPKKVLCRECYFSLVY
jgi:hypothetical protein